MAVAQLDRNDQLGPCLHGRFQFCGHQIWIGRDKIDRGLLRTVLHNDASGSASGADGLVAAVGKEKRDLIVLRGELDVMAVVINDLSAVWSFCDVMGDGECGRQSQGELSNRIGAIAPLHVVEERNLRRPVRPLC